MTVLICADCKDAVTDEGYYTMINPEGGYGLPQVLICDDCMRSGRWEHWKSEHWPNWPEKRVAFADKHRLKLD